MIIAIYFMVESSIGRSVVPETVIEITVYNEVHDAVQNEQKMIDGGRTNEPNRRNESISTSNYRVTMKHFIQVQ